MISFSATIPACDKGEQWKQALTLLYKMRDTGTNANVISFTVAISACEKGGQWEQALTLLPNINGQKLPSEAGKSADVISISAAISVAA